MDVEEATANNESTTGTVVQVFLIVRRVPEVTWTESG
jgi:hypothetical protein